jgi:hypothetical protein
MEAILDVMREAGWIRRGRGGWLLGRVLAGLTVADIYERFVYYADPRLPLSEPGQALDRRALELAVGTRENLGLSVAALFEETAPGRADAGARAPQATEQSRPQSV